MKTKSSIAEQMAEYRKIEKRSAKLERDMATHLKSKTEYRKSWMEDAAKEFEAEYREELTFLRDDMASEKRDLRDQKAKVERLVHELIDSSNKVLAKAARQVAKALASVKTKK